MGSGCQNALHPPRQLGLIDNPTRLRPSVVGIEGDGEVPASDTSLPALCLMAVAPARLAAGVAGLMPEGGRILNLSTRSAQETFPGLGLYCMSKHALRSVGQSLQMELAPGIAMAELIPGEVDTAMQSDLRQPDPGGFAMAEFFRDNRANLIPVALAARFCLWVLTQTSQRQLTSGPPWYI
jgi:NAD(P)-dependent dehydrogenase (short-subunit alcohol dehydrogenase family)